MSAEEKRMKHQKELAAKLDREAKERMSGMHKAEEKDKSVVFPKSVFCFFFP